MRWQSPHKTKDVFPSFFSFRGTYHSSYDSKFQVMHCEVKELCYVELVVVEVKIESWIPFLVYVRGLNRIFFVQKIFLRINCLFGP